MTKHKEKWNEIGVAFLTSAERIVKTARVAVTLIVDFFVVLCLYIWATSAILRMGEE